MNISRKISYWIKRRNVGVRQKRDSLIIKNAMKLMDIDQREYFNIVVETAKNNPEWIRYDKQKDGTFETLLLGPSVIISLYKNGNDYVVQIENHRDFPRPQWFHEASFQYLTSIVDAEAHRYRRRLKKEARTNNREILKRIKIQLNIPES